MVNCCVPYCTSYQKRKKKEVETDDTRVSYHEFPADLILRGRWLTAIARKDFVVNDKSSSSVVCNKHFREEDFVQGTRTRRLKKGSIPCIFPHYPKYLQPSETPKVLNKKRKLCDFSCEREGTSDFSDDEAAHLLMSFKKVNSSESSKESPDNSAVNFKNVFTQTDFSYGKESMGQETNSKEVDEKISEVQCLKKKLANKAEEIQKLTASVTEMKKKLETYTTDIHHQNLDKILTLDSEGISSTKQVFLITQLKYMFSEVFRWPEKVLRECILFHAVSPYGYRTIVERNLMTLPSKITLKKYTVPMSNATAISPLIKCTLEEEVAEIRRKILLLDY